MTLNPRARAGENPERSGYTSPLSQTWFPGGTTYVTWFSGTNGRHCCCPLGGAQPLGQWLIRGCTAQ